MNHPETVTVRTSRALLNQLLCYLADRGPIAASLSKGIEAMEILPDPPAPQDAGEDRKA